VNVILSDGGLALPLLVQILNLSGTMEFAVVDAFGAIEHLSDTLGIILLARITGLQEAFYASEASLDKYLQLH
jgi:hypothetical protein